MNKTMEANLLSTKIHNISDKLWKIALFGPDNYRAAVISHYLRTKDRKLKKYAVEYSTDLLKGYLNGELTSKVAEEALQYIIKFDEDVLFPTPANPTFTFIDLFAGIG